MSSPAPRGQRHFGGLHPFRLTPISVGNEYDVRVESMSRRGDSGVARIQGLVVFISGAKTGDSVRIRIDKVGKGFATAAIVQESTSLSTTTTTTAVKYPSSRSDNEIDSAYQREEEEAASNQKVKSDL